MENEWSKVKLVDIIQFNPKESIKKGEIAKKVAMEKLEPFTRKISGFEEAKFTSGSKFRNGDTLLARITPCLENGKTAQVDILDKDEIGFGSTEYIVLREKLGITDNDFIYYLSISPEFRNVAIKAMNGSSGRQRVQKDVLENSEFLLPPLDEQKAIAKILSDLDEKIETNNKINKKLEEMAQAIFKQWFVDFEFPNEEGKPYKSSGGEMIESELGMIPNGWRVKLLKDYCDVKKGLSYKGKHLVEDGVPMINLGNVNPGGGFRSDKCKFYDGDFKEQHTVKAGDIIIANTDMTQDRVILGSPILVPDFKTESIIFTHHLFAFRNLKIPKSFLYYYLKSKSFRERAESYATGTTVLAISRDSVLNINFVKANNEVLNKFDLITKSILDRIKNNNLEIEKLQKLRDTLLPKLMSGEIRVPIN